MVWGWNLRSLVWARTEFVQQLRDRVAQGVMETGEPDHVEQRVPRIDVKGFPVQQFHVVLDPIWDISKADG